MTDQSDPTALRLEGQRLVEADIRWAQSIAGPLKHIPPGDRSQRERALVVLSDACTTQAEALTKAEQERDEAVKRAAELQEQGRQSARSVADDTIEKLDRIAALRARAEAAEARAAAMEAALEEISGHAPVKTPPDYATSSDTGEAFDDGYSRGVWEMGQIADAALAQPGTGGAT